MSDSNDLESRDVPGPHQAISTADARERFACTLFDRLWDRYRKRATHVAAYEQLVRSVDATFVNDHIAFRTIACQQPATGIASVSRPFEALGYRPAGCYQFEDKHLNASHFQHPNPQFPKLFISELKTWELGAAAREAILRSLADHRPALSNDTLAALQALNVDEAEQTASLLEALTRELHELPWSPPEKTDVEALNAESQYGAWVLVHGYHVNHFTSLINSHGVESLGNIEKTVDELRGIGVPMKSTIEGAPGSKLRQTATEAAVIDVAIRQDGQVATIPWTYAYFELAERGEVTDPESGNRVRFEGFLGPQATNLFDMTKLDKS